MYYVAYYSVICAVVVSIVVLGFGVKWSLVFAGDDGRDIVCSGSPVITPFPVIIVPPIKNLNDVWLDELDSILPSVFCESMEQLSPVEVGNTIYPHCIGVCIQKS